MNKHWTDKSKRMNDLADRIAGLSPAKRALMELRLKKKEPVVSGEQRIPQRDKRSSAPLSFAQQRLWFLDQLGTSSAYNMRLAIRLKGSPNIKALEDSLNEIIWFFCPYTLYIYIVQLYLNEVKVQKHDDYFLSKCVILVRVQT